MKKKSLMRVLAFLALGDSHRSFYYMGLDTRSPQYASYYAQYCTWFQATYGYQYQPQCSQYIPHQVQQTAHHTSPHTQHQTVPILPIKPSHQQSSIERHSDSSQRSTGDTVQHEPSTKERLPPTSKPKRDDDDDEEEDDLQEEPLDQESQTHATASSTDHGTAAPCNS